MQKEKLSELFSKSDTITSHFHLSNDKEKILFYLEPETARQDLSVIRCQDLSPQGNSIVSMPECHYTFVRLSDI